MYNLVVHAVNKELIKKESKTKKKVVKPESLRTLPEM
jgi:hypothetical protein